MSGRVRVIDGDTLDMSGVRIRLWGIDAPEMQQTCEGQDRQTYECGRDSAAVMRELTRDRTVACDPRGHDQYGRTVAVCRTEAGDVSAAIVRRGWAVDWPRYSHGRYQSDEQEARAPKASGSGPDASSCRGNGGTSILTEKLAARLPMSAHQAPPVQASAARGRFPPGARCPDHFPPAPRRRPLRHPPPAKPSAARPAPREDHSS